MVRDGAVIGGRVGVVLDDPARTVGGVAGERVRGQGRVTDVRDGACGHLTAARRTAGERGPGDRHGPGVHDAARGWSRRQCRRCRVRDDAVAGECAVQHLEGSAGDHGTGGGLVLTIHEEDVSEHHVVVAERGASQGQVARVVDHGDASGVPAEHGVGDRVGAVGRHHLAARRVCLRRREAAV